MRCPHCNREIDSARFGVFMSPLKAALVDHIAAAGQLGISSQSLLYSDAYSGRRKPTAATIRIHVWQINSLLAATDYHIGSDRRRWYLRHAK